MMIKRRLSFRLSDLPYPPERFPKGSSRGFSIIELIVVVAIFLTITSVILFNQNRFSSNSSIQNLAYAMALSIREAQVYGLSVRGSSPNSNATFDTAFGIHFDCLNPTSYILFADMDGNGIYDGQSGGDPDGGVEVSMEDGEPGVDIERSVFNLDSGNKISNIITSGEKDYSCPDVERVDITFKRPRPEAIIKDVPNGDQAVSQVEIDIISALKDLHQKIIVTAPGQIYVTN